MNLATIVDGHGEGAPALHHRGSTVSYGELRAEVGRLRAGLVALGIRPGDRVAVVAANTPLFVTSYLAALGAGAVAVPLNPASPAAELEGQLAATGARVAVVGPAAREAFAGVDRLAVAVEHVLVPAGVALDGAETVDDGAGRAGAEVPVVDVDDDAPAALLFTSGTAGAPRAACLTHGNLRANVDQAQAQPGGAVGPGDVVLAVLPLFHIFGLNAVLGVSLAAGASVVLVERFDPTTAAETVAAHGVTVLAGAPPMWTAWATMPGLPADGFRTVRVAVSGAARLAPETAAAVHERLGVTVAEGYGLTEAAPVVTSSLGGETRPGSVGRPLPGVEVRLVDDEGEDALVGDPGEVWVRGPNVFAGYWEDPEATAAALTGDGWLRTGDVAVADDDGWLYLVDRAKDLVIVSGFNVFPGEVEEVLREHPRVADVAVVGVDHPYSGEAVHAYVVPADGAALDEDEVVEFAATRLARYKCPTKVTFVAEIPHGLAGKVLRRALRSSREPDARYRPAAG